MTSTTKKKATPALLVALVLAVLVAAWSSTLASAQQYSDPSQYAPQPGGPVTATGVLERAAPHDPDPTPIYAITDEATGTPYELTSGFVELEPFVGERVTIEGVSVPGSPPPGAPVFLNVTSITPADDPGGGEEETATLFFELAVEGEPPADATFSGFIPAEGGISAPLADPDGDGLYTGSTTVDRFGPGPRPVPTGTEPVSLPVQIVQDDAAVIKDFGLVKIDGDRTFEASVSFGGGGGQEVSASGTVEPLETTSYGYGTHALTDGGAPVYALESGSVDLDDHAGQPVTVYGALVPGYENGVDGGPPLVEVSRVEAAPPDGETYGFEGTITSISGSVVLVEEDPSAAGSGDKGYFTVTDETEISRLVGGDALAPAAFEDLEVGQPVEAAYAGAVAESYPTQGNAASIVILEEDGGEKETATLSFELTVEGEPPAGTQFFGNVRTGEGGPGLFVPLADPDGDGLYAGSTSVDRFGPGPRPVPPGTEPVSLPVRITQGKDAAIKDFGLVKLDGDKTFEASVSFGDDPGGNDPGGNGPGGNGSGTGGSGGGSDNDGGWTLGGIVDKIRSLPETGGVPLLMAVAGALLIGGGLIVRRVIR
jgi:hypothetical protein